MASTLPKKIDAIKFGLLSPDEIRKMSVQRIVTADTFDEDGTPIPNGLMDSALGTIDPGTRCSTCGNRIGGCPGHFGHIELQRPIIHVGFNKTIYKILQVICRKCSRIMLPPKEINRYVKILKKKREETGSLDIVYVEEVWKRAKRNRDQLINPKSEEEAGRGCYHCNEFQHKVRLEKPTTYYEEFETAEGTKVSDKLSPLDVQNRLKQIPDDDCLLLGIDPESARPEWMVLDVLLVPPVSVRPSITLDSGIRSEDDLTHKLVDIIRINQKLYDNRESGAPQLIVEDLWELLQYHVTTYFDNEVSGIPPARHRSGRALRTLAQRLKGKEGRFRSNLSGKRVDFSARTVISPDPLLSINQVGVPKEIAEILTVPERVTEWNIEEMKELVMQGPKGSPGVNYIIRDDGRRVDLRFARDPSVIANALRPGFIIERHLRDGDIVLFNRQPSLHRMSIMAHEVKVMPFKTFRLNLSVCLSGDTEMFTDFGKVRMDNLVKDISRYSPMSAKWEDEKSVYFSGIKKSFIINPSELGLKSYQITTKAGRTIKATSEHPFYTAKGMIRAQDLKVGDKLAIYPIELPDADFYGKQIANENEFIEFLNNWPNVYKEKTLKTIKSLKLLNIPSTSPKRILLARLIGHLIGDGSLLIKPEGGRVVFRSSSMKDIERIRDDILKLGIEPTPIKKTVSKGFEIVNLSGKTTKPIGTIYCFEIRRKPLALYFNFLGVPEGDRTTQAFPVPEWIKNGSKAEQREFLRSYFGAEMTTPTIRKESAKRMSELRFKIVKTENVDPYAFLEDIQEMLEGFDVRTKIRKPLKGNIRKKDGKATIVYTVAVMEEDSNLYNFFTKIGYEYATNKEVLARYASEYYRHKLSEIAHRTEMLHQSHELRQQGYTYAQIEMETGLRKSQITAWHTSGVSSPRTDHDFPSFEEWKAENTTEGGFIWDQVQSIEEIFLEKAYDITTADENHNFVAAQFLTSNCRPYNADFDGDEMNLHVPQSEEARAEAAILMKVQEQISTPRYGGPIIGAIQDFITSAYFLTRSGTFFDRKVASELLTAAGVTEIPEPDKVDMKGNPLWSGRSIFSSLLPKSLNFQMKNKLCECSKTQPDGQCLKEKCPTDGYVIIRNGKLIAGVIDKNGFGAEVPNSVLHRILKENGTDVTRRFLDGVTRMLVAYITRKGFSIGVDAVEVPAEGRARILKEIEEKKKEVDELIKKYREGKLERIPGNTLEETLEVHIQDILAKARDEAGNISAEYLGMKNEAVIMAKTGARGNMINLAQMSACVGQQSVRGNRIMRGYKDRTLPHFKPGDLSADAHGFVNSSFRSGLNPIEFFMHACGGREGLVDTAVRTSSSGYMQRRLVNAMQDLASYYDRTVRNSTGEIIQFKFGEDNIDPGKSDFGKAVNLDVILQKVLDDEEE